jgi:capsular exopolysaccharide synthesis family protein
MIPGVSRSGATIMGARAIRVDRATAAEFSFFLAIPTMLGAAVFDLYKNWSTLDWHGGGTIALGFLAAFVVNAELAVVMEVLRDRFTVEEQDDGVTEVTGLPVLAQVPSGGASGTVEAVRTLRTNLMFMQTTEQLRTVAVVSVNPGAGKTFTAVHLALSVAGLDVPVVLVDADLRRPSVHRQVGVDVSPGLSDLLAGSPLGATVQRAPDSDHLSVLSAGSPVPDPTGLVGGQAFSDALAELHRAAMVVVDTPACGLFADGLAVSSQCDATIVVVDARGTKRRSLRRLIEQLRRVGANPIGVVVNRVEPPARSSYYSYRPKAVAER